MTTYISYIRVSTQKQGSSGLGLEAQRAAINAFIKDSRLESEYIEIESGRNNDRPQLREAIAHAKAIGATLVIAKLDRLARDVFFITGLMKQNVDFVAADMPFANTMMLQMMAVIAEFEAKQISERTKVALQAAKARGVILGTPQPNAGVAARVANTARRLEPAVEVAKAERAKGKTLREIAAALMTKGIVTDRGKDRWQATQVRRLLKM